MEEDRIRWDQRYTERTYPDQPAALVREFAASIQGGFVLDIAAGQGRNGLYFSRRGFEVEALDISEVGLQRLRERDQRIKVRKVDLDEYDLPQQTYDVILNFNYLNRRLFPQIKEALRPNGLLLFQTFVVGKDLLMQGRPKRLSHYLRTNELLRAFLDLRVEYYREEELPQEDGRIVRTASLVAWNS